MFLMSNGLLYVRESHLRLMFLFKRLMGLYDFNILILNLNLRYSWFRGRSYYSFKTDVF